jgi:6-phosphogluconate dehydrogenase
MRQSTELGVIGLGKMGHDMSRRLLGGGCRVVVFDIDQDKIKALADMGAIGAESVSDVICKLTQPRAIWLMLPAGEPTDTTIQNLSSELSPGDVIIDGGNSNYRDSIRHAGDLSKHGIQLIDVGVSGGIWGCSNGYCLMIGGSNKFFKRLEPIFKILVAPGGYFYAGDSGAGHFVKMVHNGIEYGIMQSYAEGFELLDAKREFGFDLAKIADVWGHGSVIRSWLLELISKALKRDASLKGIAGRVEESGEGRWLVKESVDLRVPISVISLSLQVRFRSKQEKPFAERLLAKLRGEFGGHSVEREP